MSTVVRANALMNAPSEVLTHIFDFALHGDIWMTQAGSPLRSHIPTEMDTPLPFMLVCRRWNEVASSDAGLWSSFAVSISLLESPIDEIHRIPALFDHTIRKSARHPLTLNFTIAQDGPYETVIADDIGARIGTFFELVLMAVDQCDRWRNVLIYIDFNPFIEPLSNSNGPDLSLQLKRMPMLVSLEVYNDAPLDSSWAICVEVAPHNSLAVLSLHYAVEISLPTDVPSIESTATFSNLRELVLYTSGKLKNFGTRWTIVKHSPFLEELRCSVTPIDAVRHINPLLPCLELTKFALTGSGLVHPDTRLIAQTMPHLVSSSPRELIIYVKDLDENFLNPEVQSFLERFGRDVVILNIHFRNRPLLDKTNESSLMKVLQPMSNLTGLLISFRGGPGLEHGLPGALLDTLISIFSDEELEAMRQLSFVCLDINAHAVIRDFVRHRNLVITIHNTCRGNRVFVLRLHVKCDTAGDDLDDQQQAERLLMEDEGVKRCTRASFFIVVNGKCVQA